MVRTLFVSNLLLVSQLGAFMSVQEHHGFTITNIAQNHFATIGTKPFSLLLGNHSNLHESA